MAIIAIKDAARESEAKQTKNKTHANRASSPTLD
jgi:hypothetical protein